MEYYILNNSLDEKIVGKYPQAETALYNCDIWEDPRFIDHESTSFKKNNFLPITAKAVMKNKAKLTDFIYLGIIGFSKKPLISEQLKSILMVSSNIGLQFYNSPVIFKNNEIEGYWVLNPYVFNMDVLDFEKANVYLMENTFNKVKKLDVFNYDVYLGQKALIERKGYPFSILIENISIQLKTTEDFLVIENVEGGVKYLVSEKLRQHLEAEGITGIEYQPSNISFNEWLAPGGERERLYGKIN